MFNISQHCYVLRGEAQIGLIMLNKWHTVYVLNIFLVPTLSNWVLNSVVNFLLLFYEKTGFGFFYFSSQLSITVVNEFSS
jgi:hypothetical protein